MFELARQGAVDVISGNVPLNRDYIADATAVFERALDKGQPRLVLQLQNVPLIDSAGLELLLEMRRRCMLRGGAMQLASPTALCRDILQATGVAEQFAVFDDLLSAVGSYSQ